MSHEVESMMYTGEVPWHGLGTFLGNQPITAKEAIKTAGLDWTVYLDRLYRDVGGEEYKVVDGYRLVVRYTSHQDEVLGLVSDQYIPLQNRDAFTFFDSVVGKDKAIYHTAGSLRKGKIVWILAKLPDTIEVLRNDIVDKYLLLSNSHDGTMAVRIILTPVRVVCMNTLSMALNGEDHDAGEFSNATRISHRGDFQKKWKSATDLLGLVNQTYSQITESWQTWANIQLKPIEVRNYIKKIYPQKGKNLESPYNVWAYDMRGKVEHLVEVGKGTYIPGVVGSLWGVYNAVVEAQDWGSQLGKTTAGKERRLYSTWYGNSALIKIRAANVADQIAMKA